jgi:aminoglycoside phosphotransferase (APT) family kinase protein
MSQATVFLARHIEALQAWLQPRLPELEGPLTAHKVDGGQSNPTWILENGHCKWVLRAKPAPMATLMTSAHAIEREYQVLEALQTSKVPVPRVRALCEDESVIGVAFYVMDFVDGRVLRDVTLQDLPVAERAPYFHAMCDTLAALHKTDARAAGLQDFGRWDGYFSRLIRRWGQQYLASVHTPSEPMDKLMTWLPAHIPTGADTSQDTCISHGDFRLENMIFDPREARVASVLDWELSTLGHPLGDLAYNCMTWHLPPGLLRGLAGTDTDALGLPSQRSYVQRYCQATGRDFAAFEADWPFYLAFNLFRLSAILQGISKRHQQGMAASASAGEVGAMALPVAERGWALASGVVPAFIN